MSEQGSRTKRSADAYHDVPCGILTLLPDGIIETVNARMAAWLDCAEGELLGRRFQSVLSVPARIFYETNISPLLRMQGFVDEIAVDFLGSDGSKVPTLVNAREHRDEAGAHTQTYLAVFKATERRRYERALVEAKDATERIAVAERETSQLREQFIAVLGHDLRNPLASINSGVRLLAQRETLSARGERILSLMLGSVMRASELVDNVMDFARGRLAGGITLNREALAPLAPVLEQVIAEIASVASDRMIRSDIAIAVPVDCDHVRIGQLLSNLLGNAVAHGSRAMPITVEAKASDGTLTISVANGGAPIDAATREHLFQPFFRGDRRANQAGLGLGLHIASEIAKAHGGELAVTSDESETRFTFSMPTGRSDMCI